MGDLTRPDGAVPDWLELLAPLPEDARPVRRPVLSDELKAAHAGSEVAGWTTLTLHLSAPGVGLRVLQATLDQDDRLLSGSDLVHRERPGIFEQNSLGGRFEADGSFNGTRWQGTADSTTDLENTEWDLRPSKPTTEDGNRLRELLGNLKLKENS